MRVKITCSGCEKFGVSELVMDKRPYYFVELLLGDRRVWQLQYHEWKAYVRRYRSRAVQE